MNYELQLALIEILDDNKLSHDFFELDDMDSMYEFCQKIKTGYSEDEFDEGIAEIVNYLNDYGINELQEAQLDTVAGGFGIKSAFSKTMATVLSTLTLGSVSGMPSTFAAGISPSQSAVQTKSWGEKISDKWSKTKEAVAYIYRNHKKAIWITTGTLAALAGAGTIAYIGYNKYQAHKKEIEELRQNLEHARQETTRLEAEAGELRAQAETLTQQKRAAEQDLVQAQASARKAQENADAAIVEQQRLTQEKAENATRIQELNTQLKEGAAKTEKEKRDLTAQIEGLNGKQRELTTQLEAKTQESEARQAALIKAQERAKTAEAKVTETTQAMAKATKAHETQLAELTRESQTAKEKADATIASKDKELEQARTQYAAAEKERAGIQERFIASQREVEAARAQREAVDKKAAKAEADIQAAQAKQADFKQREAELNGAIIKMETALGIQQKEAQATTESLQARLQQLNERIPQLQAQLDVTSVAREGDQQRAFAEQQALLGFSGQQAQQARDLLTHYQQYVTGRQNQEALDTLQKLQAMSTQSKIAEDSLFGRLLSTVQEYQQTRTQLQEQQLLFERGRSDFMLQQQALVEVQRQKEDSDARVLKAQQEAAEAKKQQELIRQAAEQAKKAHDEIQHQLSLAQGNIRQLEGELSTKEAARDAAEKQANAAKLQLGEDQREFDAQKARLEAERDQAKGKEEAAKKARATAQKELEKAREQTRTLSDTTAELGEQIKQLQLDLRSQKGVGGEEQRQSQEQITALQRQLKVASDAAEARSTELNDTIRGLRRQLGEAQVNGTGDRATIANLTDQIRSLSTARDVAQGQVQQLQALVDQQMQQIHQSQTMSSQEKAILEQRASTLQTELQRAHTDLAAVQGTVIVAQSEASRMGALAGQRLHEATVTRDELESQRIQTEEALAREREAQERARGTQQQLQAMREQQQLQQRRDEEMGVGEESTKVPTSGEATPFHFEAPALTPKLEFASQSPQLFEFSSSQVSGDGEETDMKLDHPKKTREKKEPGQEEEHRPAVKRGIDIKELREKREEYSEQIRHAKREESLMQRRGSGLTQSKAFKKWQDADPTRKALSDEEAREAFTAVETEAFEQWPGTSEGVKDITQEPVRQGFFSWLLGQIK